MALPFFPSLVPVEKVRARDLASATAPFPPYSPFNGLWLLCSGEVDLVARFGDGLITIGPDGSSEAVSVLCRDASRRELEGLRDYLGQGAVSRRLSRVPECSLDPLGIKTAAPERPDRFDYLVAVSQLVSPKTEAAQALHLAAQGYAQGPGRDAKIVEVELDNQSVRDELVRVSEDWRDASKVPDAGRDREVQAIRRCLAQHRDFSLVTLAAYSETGSMLGFTINEPLPDRVFMGHFGKTAPRSLGLSVLLEIETARAMATRGCTTMNYQEDLGNHGLRKLKRAWGPCGYLKVYDVPVYP